MEFRQIELYFVFLYGMSSDYIVVLWNVIRLYCLFYGVSSDYIVCSENQDLDSRRVQRGHSIGVPPAKKKN